MGHTPTVGCLAQHAYSRAAYNGLQHAVSSLVRYVVRPLRRRENGLAMNTQQEARDAPGAADQLSADTRRRATAFHAAPTCPSAATVAVKTNTYDFLVVVSGMAIPTQCVDHTEVLRLLLGTPSLCHSGKLNLLPTETASTLRSSDARANNSTT